MVPTVSTGLKLFRSRLHTRTVFASKEIVFDPAIIRRICKQLAVEQDSQRARELLLLLDAAVRDDQEEVRLQLNNPAKRYKPLLEDEEAISLLENGAA
jgi:hypothetical protein